MIEDWVNSAKATKSIMSKTHDKYILDIMKTIKKKETRIIEKAGTFFITCDNKLAEFNKTAPLYNRKYNFYIPEILFDKYFTLILFSKTFSYNLPLNSILSACESHSFLDDKFLEHYQKCIVELKQEGKIDSDIGDLLTASDYSEDILLDIANIEYKNENDLKNEIVFNVVPKIKSKIKNETKSKYIPLLILALIIILILIINITVLKKLIAGGSLLAIYLSLHKQIQNYLENALNKSSNK